MAQHAGGDVALAAIGVGQRAVFALRNGVDGQVAPRQVFFERDIRGGVHGKAAVALGRLALGTGQRIFLTAGRMQKHRKVLADRYIALRHQRFGRGADHDPVAVLHRQAQQGIANRTADHVNLHAPSVGSAALGAGGSQEVSAAAGKAPQNHENHARPVRLEPRPEHRAAHRRAACKRRCRQAPAAHRF